MAALGIAELDDTVVVDPPLIAAPPADVETASAPTQLLEQLFHAHFSYVWRMLRRLGLNADDADDAAQRVFIIASRRVHDFKPGRERAFLYSIAWRIADKQRRSEARRREEPIEYAELAANEPEMEELLDRNRTRELLDSLLSTMPLDLRVVFVLYEIDGLTSPEIAEVVGVPVGTVASRLRRAREDFNARLARLEARRRSKPGGA
jgi:RNA polymerase sigma-70 factor (ECF subfamily)